MNQVLHRLLGICLVAGAAGPLVATQERVQRVIVANVGSRVEIKFDAAQVAHVFAASREDAAYGLGFIHARQRPSQLDVARRLVHGRLSELAGARGIEHDKLVRRLGLAGMARREFEALPPVDRRILEAYARGINQGHPILPEAWTGADCVGWALLMAFQLSGNWQTELDRAQLARTLDRSDVLLLLPGEASGGALGSNVWAVDGTRSATGRPLLANDPHLPLTMPGPWFMARLSVADVDPRGSVEVIGATTPGLPMVLIGRTPDVAWGVTRNGADTQDLYMEEVNPADASLYRTPAGWSRFESRSETIRVKGAQPVVFVVETSRNGPIVSEVPPAHRETGDPPKKVALRWTAMDGFGSSISAAMRIDQARSCGDVMRALAAHVAPVQNVLAADHNGICFRVAGRVPKRSVQPDAAGLFPSLGWTDADRWIGWLDEGSLPGRSGASSFANANQPIALHGAAQVPGEWDSSHRFDRIESLLAHESLHEVRTFQAMQYDTLSLEATQVLPVLLRARPQSPLAKFALERIESFGGNMRPEDTAPLIYTAWMDELTRLLLGRRLGGAQFNAMYERRLFRPALHRILLDPLEGVRWCLSPQCTREIGEALERAVSRLAASHGTDPSKWAWGEAHKAHGLSIGGDPWTIQMTHFGIDEQEARFPVTVGPNVRMVHDLSDRNASRFVQLGGPGERLAGGAGSDWQIGRYRELRFEPAAWQDSVTILPQR